MTTCRLPAYGVHDGAKLVVCSEELAEMFGAASSSEVLGKDVLTFIAPEARDRSIAAVVSGEAGTYGSLGVRLDGGTFPIQVTSSSIRLRDCEGARLVMIRDLSPVAVVVDDEPHVARMTASLMRHVGYQPVMYTKPAQALAEYRKDGASVVVSDILMPDLDGVALARRIREIDPDVPVIFVSGYSTEIPPQDETTLFVKKPFGIADLEGALATLPERARRPLK